SLVDTAPSCSLFPYTTLFRSAVGEHRDVGAVIGVEAADEILIRLAAARVLRDDEPRHVAQDVAHLRARALRERVAIDVHGRRRRSEEHTSELQSPDHLVCRLL